MLYLCQFFFLLLSRREKRDRKATGIIKALFSMCLVLCIYNYWKTLKLLRTLPCERGGYMPFYRWANQVGAICMHKKLGSLLLMKVTWPAPQFVMRPRNAHFRKRHRRFLCMWSMGLIAINTYFNNLFKFMGFRSRLQI